MSEPVETTPGTTSTAAVVLGLLALHALFALRFPWEADTARESWLRLSPDLALMLATCLLVRARRFPLGAAALLLSFLPIYRFGATIQPVFFGKELDLYDDLHMLPGLLHLFLHEYARPVQWLLLAVFAAGLVLFVLAVHRSLSRASRGLGERGRTREALGLLLLLALVGLGERAFRRNSESLLWSPWLLGSLWEDLGEIYPRYRKTKGYAAGLEQTEERLAALPKDLAGLTGVDVYVLFIESYGSVVLADEEMAGPFGEAAQGWARTLEEDGFQVVSGLCFPWINGGLSSLAHAQLFCGAPVTTRRTFSILLDSEIQPLPRAFRDAGYRTLNVQPAQPSSWPEGREFYGFDEELFRDAFAYDGHDYHWGDMPDQFALAHLLDERVRESDDPLFVLFVSVTNHATFSMVPPYFEDWDLGARTESYRRPPEKVYPIGWRGYMQHPQLREAYMDTVRYSLTTVAGFAGELERPSLLIVLGDHQPPGLGASTHSRDVPIHVLSNRPELLLPFRELGFAAGFVPPPELEGFSTVEFLPFFLRAFSGTAGDDSSRASD